MTQQQKRLNFAAYQGTLQLWLQTFETGFRPKMLKHEAQAAAHKTLT
jgi:hypothetical protein